MVENSRRSSNPSIAAPTSESTTDRASRQKHIGQFGKLLASVASSEEMNIVKGLLGAMKVKRGEGERKQIPPICKDIVDMFLKYNPSVGRELVGKLQAIVPGDVKGVVMEEWRKGLVRKAQGEMEKGIEDRKKGIYEEEEKVIVVEDSMRAKPPQPKTHVDFSNPGEQDVYMDKIAALGKGQEIRMAKEKEARRIIDAHKKSSKSKSNPFSTSKSTSAPAVCATSKPSIRPSKRMKLLSAANPSISSFMSSLKPNSPAKQVVPSSVECNICRETPTDPHISACKHVACKGCWDKWIKVQSQKGERRCMSCKREIGELARCVFK